ncbi:MAG: TIGR04086 family membrane protein [Clostridia bacterium]|nr:TIGR04086 family membrane protein [Clostridia bacterium]
MFKSKSSPVIALFKGILISYIITMLVFIIFALLITYTDISEKHIGTVIRITTAIVCILSGFITAGSANKGGLIWGIISGISYVIIMCIVGYLLLPDYSITSKLIVSLMLAVAGGGLGGVVGINLK